MRKLCSLPYMISTVRITYSIS